MNNETIDKDLLLEWDLYEIAKGEVEYIMNEAWDEHAEQFDNIKDEDTIFGYVFESHDFGQNWDDMLNALTELMDGRNPDSDKWFATVRSFGWRSRDGCKEFQAETGKELLDKILPNTECAFKIFNDNEGKSLKLQNFHHDSPVGNEWYYIYPRSYAEEQGMVEPEE